MRTQRLYFVRHGETVWNREGRLQGGGDSPLTEKGAQQADELGFHLKKYPLELILSSTLGRALQTAQIIRRHLPNLAFLECETAREISLGVWEGMLWADIETRWPEAARHWTKAPHMFAPVSEGCESFHDVRSRAMRFLDEVRQSRSEEEILVVSHGIFIKSLLALVAGIPVEHVLTSTPHSRRSTPFVINLRADGNVDFLPEFSP